MPVISRLWWGPSAGEGKLRLFGFSFGSASSVASGCVFLVVLIALCSYGSLPCGKKELNLEALWRFFSWVVAVLKRPSFVFFFTWMDLHLSLQFCVCSLNFLDVMIVGFEFVVAIFAVGDVYEQMGVLFT